MGLMIVAGAETSVVLTLLLIAALGLTFWETRELQLDKRMTLWWLLLVVLIHVPGYLALRVWGFSRRRADA